MEISLFSQSMSLGCFALLGLGLGLLYDLLRPMRYSGGPALLWDGIFCAAAASGCFVLSMNSGRLGQWELAAALLLFCLYINILSPHLLPHILGITQTMYNCYKIIVIKLKKLPQTVKKFFTNHQD